MTTLWVTQFVTYVGIELQGLLKTQDMQLMTVEWQPKSDTATGIPRGGLVDYYRGQRSQWLQCLEIRLSAYWLQCHHPSGPCLACFPKNCWSLTTNASQVLHSFHSYDADFKSLHDLTTIPALLFKVSSKKCLLSKHQEGVVPNLAGFAYSYMLHFCRRCVQLGLHTYK